MSAFLQSELGVVCPSCDVLLAPRATACSACGADLAQPSPANAPPRTSSSIATAAATAWADEIPEPVVRTGGHTPVPPGMRPAPRHTPPGATPRGGVAAFAPVAAAPPEPVSASPGPWNTPAPEPFPIRTTPSAMPRASSTPPGGAPVAKAAAGPRFGLTVVAGKSRGARFRLPATGITVGSARTALVFEDPFVSAHHATLLVRDGVLHVRDEASVSGTLVSIAGQEVLPPGACFSAGPRLFRYGGTVVPPIPVAGHPIAYGAPTPSGQALYLVEELLSGGRPGRAIASGGPLITFGYGPCDFSVPQEEGLAARHCELSPGPASALLRDLSGGLGTYVRLAPRTERALRIGDHLRFGQHIIRIESPI